jgi:hypothetical protein
MSYINLYETISKPFITTKDIMSILNCGRNSAIRVRKEIEEEVLSSGKRLPIVSEKVVPTINLLSRFNLDADYIFEMAKREKAFN